MRLESVHLHNVGPFDDYLLDLSDLGEARLIAIVGPNGSGKSTLLETAIPGAVFRVTPTRGSLVSLATARDSFVESRIINGKAWTLRHSLDCVSGKSEALVLDESGAPVLPDTKVRSFDAWAAQTFPEAAVLLSSVFGSQAGDGFLGAKPGERKAILLRILGVERLERLAELARERSRTTGHEFDVVGARLGELGATDVEAAATALESARATATWADERLTQARNEFERARTQAAEAERAWERRRDQVARRAELRERIEKAELDVTAADAQLGRARQEVTSLDRKIANNRDLLERRDAIEAAVRRRDELVTKIATTEEQLRSLSREADSLRNEQARLEREAAEATRRVVQQRRRADRLRADVDRAEQAEAVAADLPKLREELEAAKARLSDGEQGLDQLRGERIAGAEERIDGLRGALIDIGDADDDPPDAGKRLEDVARLARHTIKADDEAVELSATLPKRLQDAQSRVAKFREAVDQAALAVSSCAESAALAARADADRQALAETEEQVTVEEQAIAGLRRKVEDCKAEQIQVGDRRDDADQRLCALQHEQGEIAQQAAEAPHLAAAEQRIADRTAQREQAVERVRDAEIRLETTHASVSELRDQLAATPEPDEVPAAPSPREVAILAETAAQLERSSREAHAAISVAERTLAEAHAASERTAELLEERKRLESDRSDWKRLAADLGREGLQAAEIDAAGPELTALVNDLLHSAHGPRWTVTIETQRLSADGKRTLEGCDVRVLDVERGRDTTAETLSGGERVIVGEAVSLALSMLACRRAGMERPTLVRDESGAALDGAAARSYVSMLRRAAEIVDADRVLIVSHTPEVWAMCDAEVRLH